MLLFLLSITDEKFVPKIVHLYNTYHNDMVRLARSRLKKSGCREYYYDAEDIVQECFIRIIKYIDHVDFDVPETKLKSYMFSIVANQINTIVMKPRVYESIGEEINIMESEEDFFEKLLIRERFEQVFRAMEQMSEIYKITFKYRYQDDMTVKEIAEFMGVPEKTIQTRLLRGRHLLISILDEEAHKNGK